MKQIEIPEQVQQLVEAIRYAGGHSYLAGGAVRDHLLGMRAYSDFDIEVYNMSATELIRTLEPYGNIDAVGRAFGILLFRGKQGHIVEFGLPRRENKEGQGHRGFMVEVDPTMTTYEATRRREFTMNSMLLDLHTGELIDHHGGQQDLEDGVLRATSEAYMEDPLRVLRGFQFVARYNVWPSSETIRMSKQMLDEAHTLSLERIWGEWHKWALKGYWYNKSLEYIIATEWIKLYPALMNLLGVVQDPIWHPEGDVWTHTAITVEHARDLINLKGFMSENQRLQLIFAALLHDVGKPMTAARSETSGRIIHPAHEDVGADIAKDFLKSIGAPSKLVNNVLPLVREHMFDRGVQPGNITERMVRRVSVRIQPASVQQLADLMYCDRGRDNWLKEIDPIVEEVLNVAHRIEVKDWAPKPILKGRHLIAAGLTPGPVFGVILDVAFEEQLDGAFHDEESALFWLDDALDERYDKELEEFKV